MPTVSDLLGAAGAPTLFTHKDKTYTVSPVTQRVKGAVEKWLRGLAYNDLYELRDVLPPDQYKDALATIQARRNEFGYLSARYWDEMSTERGSAGFVSILFGCSEDEALTLTRERAMDVSALTTEAILSSMPREQAEVARAKLKEREAQLAEGQPVPNPPAPA